MIFSEDDRAKFEKSIECWICQKPFEGGDDKVRDHCHFPGNSEERLITNVICFPENRNMCQLYFITFQVMTHISSSRILGKHKVRLIVSQTMRRNI